MRDQLGVIRKDYFINQQVSEKNEQAFKDYLANTFETVSVNTGPVSTDVYSTFPVINRKILLFEARLFSG